MSLKESVQRCLWMLVISAGLAGCSKPGVSDLYEGQKALENGDLQKATASFRQATQLLATPARAWNYLGLAYQRDGQYIQARDAFMQALKHDENAAQARFNLGCLLLENDQFSLAIEQFKTFGMLRPEDPRALPYLALAHLREGDLPAAQAICEDLTNNGKQSTAQALNLMGLIQQSQKKPREAYNYFHASLEVQTDYPPALWNQGMTAFPGLNRPDLAVKKLREFNFRAAKHPLGSVAKEHASMLEKQFFTAEESKPKPEESADPPAAIDEGDVAKEDPAEQEPPSNPETLSLTPEETPEASPSEEVVDTGSATTDPEVPAETPESLPEVKDAPVVTLEDVGKPLASIAKPTANHEPGVAPALAEPKETTPESTIAIAEPDEPPVVAASETTVVRLEDLNPPPGVTPLPRGRTDNPYRYLLPGRPLPGNRAEAQPWINRGNQAFQRQDFAKAIESYQKAVDADGNFFEAYFNMGLSALSGGDVDTALRAYEYALSIRPDHRDSRFNLSLALKQRDHLRDAARELETLLRQDKTD
ncbi:MAG: tetratricopeptide repeat protein, partial [Limisphaerales bacterium]